jgi:hypothetical protein
MWSVSYDRMGPGILLPAITLLTCLVPSAIAACEGIGSYGEHRPGETVGAHGPNSGSSAWTTLYDCIQQAKINGVVPGNSDFRYVQNAGNLCYFYAAGSSSGAGGTGVYRIDRDCTETLEVAPLRAGRRVWTTAGCRRNPSGVQTPTSEAACRALALDAGLTLGGNGFAFSGDFSTKGCYTYTSGGYKDRAYWGGSGATSSAPSSPQARISCAACLPGTCNGNTCNDCARGTACATGQEATCSMCTAGGYGPAHGNTACIGCGWCVPFLRPTIIPSPTLFHRPSHTHHTVDPSGGVMRLRKVSRAAGTRPSPKRRTSASHRTSRLAMIGRSSRAPRPAGQKQAASFSYSESMRRQAGAITS